MEWWIAPLWVLVGIYIVLFVIGTPLYIYRRKLPPLSARVLSLSIISALFGFTLSLTFAAQMTSPQVVHCNVVLAYGILMLPFWSVVCFFLFFFFFSFFFFSFFFFFFSFFHFLYLLFNYLF